MVLAVSASPRPQSGSFRPSVRRALDGTGRRRRTRGRSPRAGCRPCRRSPCLCHGRRCTALRSYSVFWAPVLTGPRIALPRHASRRRGAATPVNSSKAIAPWPTRARARRRRERRAVVPRGSAASPPSRYTKSTTARWLSSRCVGGTASASSSSSSCRPDGGAVDQHVGRPQAWLCRRPARRARRRARSGALGRAVPDETSRAPASSSAHTAARAVPPAPSDQRRRAADLGAARRAPDQRRGIGVVGADPSVRLEHERVGGADRRCARHWPPIASASAACLVRDRDVDASKAGRRQRQHRLVEELGRHRQQLVMPAVGEPHGLQRGVLDRRRAAVRDRPAEHPSRSTPAQPAAFKACRPCRTRRCRGAWRPWRPRRSTAADQCRNCW